MRPRIEAEILRAIFRASLDAIVTMDQSGAITGWNPRAEHMFDWSADEAVGRTLAETIIPPQHRLTHEKGLARYLFSGEGPVLGKVLDHLTALHRDGHEFPVELAISEAWQANNEDVVFVAFIRDISERKANERSRAARFAVTRALAANRRWEETAPLVLEGLCSSLGWQVAAVFDIESTAEAARYQTGWANPELDVSKFVEASRHTAFGLGVGLPGRVWKQARAAGIPDLGADANFPRILAAQESGLVSAAAFPIMDEGEVTGIVELFSPLPMTLVPGEMEVLEDIGSQIGQFRGRESADRPAEPGPGGELSI